MKNPTLSPFEAWQRLVANKHENFEHEDFTYISTGPQMSPPEFWYPVAHETTSESEGAFYANNADDEELTAEHSWSYFKA